MSQVADESHPSSSGPKRTQITRPSPVDPYCNAICNLYAAAPGYGAGYMPGQWIDDSSTGGVVVEGPRCSCGVASVLRTSNSASNPGRRFYTCVKMREVSSSQFHS